MSETVENSIVNSIPDFRDDGGADSGSVGSGSADSGSSGGRSSAQPTGADNQATSAAPRQQGTVQRRHDGLLEVPNQQQPNTRDLVDPVTGRIVAQGGIERRVYEEGQRHARENAQLRNQLQQAQQHIAGSNALLQEANRLGVTPEQHSVALRVMSDFMRDPVKTLEYLVEEVKSKGYQIPFMTQGVSQGMDMAAIGRMIDSKLQPFTDQHAANVNMQRAQAAAKQQLDTFVADNPHANHNLDVLGEMLRAQPTLTLDRAWSMMIQWAVNNGLDYTQPLKPQVNGYQHQVQQPAQQTRPLPGSRSAVNGAVPRTDTGGQYNENTSWSEIIRGAMHESGMLN